MFNIEKWSYESMFNRVKIECYTGMISMSIGISSSSVNFVYKSTCHYWTTDLSNSISLSLSSAARV